MAEKIKVYQKGSFDTKGKIIAIIVLCVVLITIWFMLNLVLLTFILAFIFYNLLKVTQKGLDRTHMRGRIHDSLILVVEYILGLGMLAMMGWAFTTILVSQVTDIANAFINFDYAKFLASLDPRLSNSLGNVVTDANINRVFDQAANAMLGVIRNTGSLSFNFILSIVLSFLILLEKTKLRNFAAAVGDSSASYLYKYFMIFGRNFCVTFGKVMKVQVTIALINSVLSLILLAILGFPSIWGLAVMIFVLGLVPVAGMIISLVPLSIIAFNVGGIIKVFWVLGMILILHALEAYVLNPKLMANRTQLPVCMVFIILLVAENYLKVWGLLIGVPLFIFLMVMLGVDYEEALKPKRKHRPWRGNREKTTGG